jgi:hypothetical protein
MRRIVYVKTLSEAQRIARWACAFAQVPGGFICFESPTDYQSYRRGT